MGFVRVRCYVNVKFSCYARRKKKKHDSYILVKTKIIVEKKRKMTEEANFADQIENDKNKTNVRCQFCNSLMIKAKEAKYCEQKVSFIP